MRAGEHCFNCLRLLFVARSLPFPLSEFFRVASISCRRVPGQTRRLLCTSPRSIRFSFLCHSDVLSRPSDKRTSGSHPQIYAVLFPFFLKSPAALSFSQCNRIHYEQPFGRIRQLPIAFNFRLSIGDLDLSYVLMRTPRRIASVKGAGHPQLSNSLLRLEGNQFSDLAGC